MDDDDDVRPSFGLPFVRRLPATPFGLGRGGRPPMMLRKLLPFPAPKQGYNPENGQPDPSLWVTQVQPQYSFKPKGLMIWGAPPAADLVRFDIGNQSQITAAWTPVGPPVERGGVPAMWFAMAQSFEQVAKAHDLGKDPPDWVDFQVCYRGMDLRAVFRSLAPLDQIKVVMWGEALVDV